MTTVTSSQVWYAHEFRELRKVFMFGPSPGEDKDDDAELQFVRSLSR